MRSRAIFRIGPGIAAIVGLSLLWGGVNASSSQLAAAPQPAAPAARELTVLVAGGQDTIVPVAFFPANVRIRAGDTVTWKHNGGLDHSVTFSAGATPLGPTQARSGGLPGDLKPGPAVRVEGGPGGVPNMRNPEEIFSSVSSGSTYSGSGFFSSGLMGREPIYPGGPDRQSFSFIFDSPGVYEYFCVIHEAAGMVGTVAVAPAGALDVPDQAAIDAQAQVEMATILANTERTRVRSNLAARSQPGPNDTTLWAVLAGNSQNQSEDTRLQLFEFFPKDSTVRAGDTVIWNARNFHSVTFVPSPPAPDPWVTVPQEDGSVRIFRHPLVAIAERPSPVFDPTRHFNSSPIGPARANGAVWALTFDRPGTFEYFCGVHREEGMTGSITVLPRS